tara:strand:+ start:888 stop:2027 length:1140 start_codon:yes stop_codon:yes gene_type:complete
MTRASDLARLIGAGGSLEGTLSVDTINEKTSGNGVTVDSLNIKDSGIGGQQIGGRKNIAYNGAMTVAQRGTSFSGITSSQYTLDRIKLFLSGAGTYTVSQSTDVPSGQGFYNSFKLDNTTSDNYGSSGDYLMIRLNAIEQQDVMKLNYASSTAKKVTVSFWAKFSYADTWNILLVNHVAQRSNFRPFTITSANTWQKIELTFDGDTNSGDGFAISASLGLSIDLWLGAGSNNTGGSAPANTWDERSNNNTSLVPASTNFGSSTDHEMYITGLQLEIGEQATPFEHRSFGDELALCQRYFYKHNINSSSGPRACQYHNSYKMIHDFFPVTMRAFPTATATFTGSFTANSLSTNVGKYYVLSSYDAGHNYYMETGQYDAEL